jgi:hypothetical protein
MAGVYGGLQPYNKIIRAKMYRIAAAYATSIFKGDAVARTTDGSVIIASLTATNYHLGAALLFYDSTKNPVPYYLGSASSLGGYVLVADHPDQEFLIAEDAVTTPLTTSCEGDLLLLAQTNAGDTSGTAGYSGYAGTGLSGMQLKSSSQGTNTAGQQQYYLVGLGRAVGNQVYDATLCPNPKWIVRLSLHQLAPGVAGT